MEDVGVRRERAALRIVEVLRGRDETPAGWKKRGKRTYRKDVYRIVHIDSNSSCLPVYESFVPTLDAQDVLVYM